MYYYKNKIIFQVSNKAYIDEVRICFDKTLSLVDCDKFKRHNNKPYTNCPLDKEIYYIGAIVKS